MRNTENHCKMKSSAGTLNEKGMSWVPKINQEIGFKIIIFLNNNKCSVHVTYLLES